jgi:hypothetical protein
MDCQTARLLLGLLRAGGPDDLGPEAQADLDAHLDTCAYCQAFAAGDAGFDAAVAAAMRAVAVPADGQTRAVAAATARRAIVVRRAWLKGVAVAAGLLLLAPAGYLGFLYSRPAVDAQELAAAFDRQRDDPERAAADWLAAQGLPPTLPARLDPRYLLSVGRVDLEGKPTPCLQFVRPRADGGVDTLQLFVLTRHRFRLAGLQAGQSSFATVQPVPEGPGHPGVAYLMLYTTPTADPFVRPAGQEH